MLQFIRLTLLTFLMLNLVACGGGSGSTTGTSNAVSVSASASQTVSNSAPVTFTGAASSSAGAITAIAWQVQVLTLGGGWPAAITNNTCSTVTQNSSGATVCAVQITPPTNVTLATTYVLTFTAVDVKGNTSNTTTTLVVNPNPDPTATVGANSSVSSGTNVPLTCSASGGTSPYTYQWLVSNPNGLLINIANSAVANTSFTAPGVTASTVVQLQCQVTDSKQNIGSATQAITILPVVQPAITLSSQSPSQLVYSGNNVDLNVTASTNGGTGVVYYSWTQISGPAVILGGASTNNAGFIAPTVTSNTTMDFRIYAGYQPITVANPGTATMDVIVTVQP